MKLLVISLSMILSNMFFFINHPIMLVIVILAQTSILCIIIFLVTFSSWFSLMMFLIFMGGLMVLFIYIASLASNEKFSINFKMLFLMLPILMMMFSMEIFFLNNQIFFNESLNFKLSIFMMYSNYSINPTIISMIYLLLTLIITVNIIKLYEAPMRSLI